MKYNHEEWQKVVITNLTEKNNKMEEKKSELEKKLQAKNDDITALLTLCREMTFAIQEKFKKKDFILPNDLKIWDLYSDMKLKVKDVKI